MESSTLRACAAIVLATLLPTFAVADDAQVAKLQQSFGDTLITVRIADFPETHDITIAAYQVLLDQGIPTTLVDMPPQEQDELRALMNDSTGWSVGVFR